MIKILIVEDEEPIANLIRMNLVKAGYQCEIASDGELAADAISERSFDLILLDIMLPKLNGYEVLEYAKSVDTPVIFLTAMGETGQKVKGLRLGAEDYIAKPFEIAGAARPRGDGAAALQKDGSAAAVSEYRH